MSKRSTTTRDRLRKRIAQGQPACWLCGEPIDYSLRYPDPRAFVVDHKTPIHRGGDEADPSNAAAAHAACNRAKSDHLDGGPIVRRSGALRR